MTNTAVKKFQRLLLNTQNSCGPHESTFELLQELAKEDKDIIKWIKKEFLSPNTIYDKSDLARIAIKTGERGFFEDYLRKNDDWKDEDFIGL